MASAPPLVLANSEALLEFGGRLHPAILHLPIGLLAGVVLLELFALVGRKPLDHSLRMMMVSLTALSAVVTMTSGLLLSREDAYSGDVLQTHKLLGIGVAIGCVLMALCASRPVLRGVYAALLLATTIVLIPAGHVGGTMTHGEGFLTAPFAGPAPSRGAPRDGQPANDGGATGDSLFAATIAPIFNGRCVGCHSDARHRAGLSLQTPDGILAGSEAGPVIVPGDPAASEMMVRLRLPADDKGHMPPVTRPQPTEAEIAAIEQWIAAGAPLVGPSDASLSDFESLFPTEPQPATRPQSPPDDALSALRAAQAHVEVVDPEARLLWIDFAGAPAITDQQAQALLAPLAPFIADLSLAGAKAGDGVLAMAANMPNLRSLDLSRSGCTPAGLKALAGHASLETLRLAQTRLDDSAIDALASLPALTRVYLWSTGISSEAAERLHAGNPDLIVDVGVADAGGQALETEGAIALSSEAPAPGSAAPSASLTPINSTCPVSGASINPKFAIVHEGKVIAFCCQDCAAKFWAEPEKYPIPGKP